MYSCYIIDDQPHSINAMIAYVERIPNLTYIGSNTDPEKAIVEVTTGEQPDIIFLEVNMERLSGLEVLKLLPKDSIVIFTTCHAHFAYHAFENNMVDFLLKPIQFNRFSKSMAKVSRILEHSRLAREKLSLDIPTKMGSLSLLNKSDILYIEVIDDMINIVAMKTIYRINSSLKDFLSKLPGSDYICINDTCAVNKSFVKYIENYTIVMHNGDRLQIAMAFRKEVLEKIKGL